MIPWLAWALAAEPVVAVSCVREVRFAAPYRWDWSAERAAISLATALVVEADPALLAPTDAGTTALHADGWPVEVLVVEGGRALVLLPFRADGPLALGFSVAPLPERVVAPERERLRRDLAPLPRVVLPAPHAPLDVPAVTAPRGSMLAALRSWTVTCALRPPVDDATP